MRAPVIAEVNGTVAGAGLGLMAAADFAIASEKAKFTSAYTKIGLTPDGSTTWFLPRLIGHRRAKELFLLNRLLSAEEAMAWGLVNRVVAPADLSPAVAQVAEQLASGPTHAFASVKRLLILSDGASLEQQMKHESASIVRMSGSRDGLAGVKAFKDKVEPSFVGSQAHRNDRGHAHYQLIQIARSRDTVPGSPGWEATHIIVLSGPHKLCVSSWLLRR